MYASFLSKTFIKHNDNANNNNIKLHAVSAQLRKPGLPSIVAALSAMFWGDHAAADDSLAPGESIMERSRPELDALGLPLGALRLFPSVDISAEHDSNIFADDDNEISDWILGVSPGFRLASDWGRHSIDASVDAFFARYQENRQEDFEDISVTGDLDFDLSPASRLRFGARYNLDHEERFSPDDVLGVEPTVYEQTRFSAAYMKRFGRVSLRFGAARTDIDYDDVPSATGTVNNDDRNRASTDFSIRAAYEVNSGIDIFVRADRGANNYEAELDDNGVDRDSEHRSIAVGLQGALTGSSYVEAFLGYTERDYEIENLTDIDSPWYDGRLVWNVSGLTTLTFEGRRDVRETTFNLASGYTATRYGIIADHELLRNLLLHASVHRRTDDYFGIDRNDDNTFIVVGTRYMMNRYFQLSLEVRQRERDSLASGSTTDNFSTRSVSLSVRAQR